MQRLILAALLVATLFCGVKTGLTPAGAQPQPHARRPSPQVTAMQSIPTLPPASVPTSLPYPAYGTPQPGVAASTVDPKVPQAISLAQAIAIGAARSPLLASARADEQLARAGVALQVAGLLPNASLAAGVNRVNHAAGANTLSTVVPAIGSTASPGFNNYTTSQFSFTLRQLIFDGGRVVNEIRSARESDVAALDTYKRELQTVAYNVATAYYNQLAAQRTTAVDVEVVRENLVQEQLVTAQYRAGVAARADIATAQLPTAQARVALVRAQGTELAAQASFANAMGLDADTDVRPADDSKTISQQAVSSIDVPNYAKAIARAYALRPDYDSAQRTVAAAEDSVRAAKLGLFPNLTGSATGTESSTNLTGGGLTPASTVGLSLAIPVFDQGITAANTAQARAQADVARANLRTAKLGVQLDVKTALANFVSSRAALVQVESELAKAVEVLNQTQAQYRAGVTTLPLLLNAQVGLTQALTDRVTAIYTLREAEQQYLYATGAI